MSGIGWKRWFILFVGLWENLIFSGSILGWSALNYMLKQEGIFVDLCHDEYSSSASPYPYRNYSIESGVSGQLEKLPLLSSYINYSVLPSIGPSADLEADAVNLPEALPLLSLPSSTTTQPSAQQSSTFPPANSSLSSQQVMIQHHKDRMLNLAYTAGIFFNGFTAFVWGFLLDKWGLRTVRLLINSFLFSGSLLLCFTSRESSYLTFPAIILLCLGGVPIRIANMQFANLFPKNRSTVITFYSGAFSSSAVLFVLLKYAYDAGVSFNTTCCSMVIAALLMLPVTFFLLPHDRVREPEPAPDSAEIMSKKKYAKGNLALVSSTMITLEKFKALESPIAGRKGIVNAVMDVEDEIALDDCESTTSSEEVIIRKRGQQQAEVNRDTEIRSATPFTGKIVILPLSSLKMSSAGVNKATCDALRGSNCKVDHAGCCKARQEASSNSHNNNSSQNCDDRPPSCSPSSSGSCRSSTDSEEMIPLSQSLFSIPFSLHQWWYSWLITYMIMYVGTMNLWLDRVTSDRQVASNFSKIFGIVQILALILAPIAGFIMDHQVNSASKEVDPFKRRLARIKAGYWPMMFTTSTLAAILICRFFNSTTAVYTSIVFITLLRSFLVAVASAYLRIRFPASHFNRLLGIMSTCGAVVTLLQFPLFVWEAHHVDNALWVNLFNCFCTFLAYLNPLHLTSKSLQRRLVAQELGCDAHHLPPNKLQGNQQISKAQSKA